MLFIKTIFTPFFILSCSANIFTKKDACSSSLETVDDVDLDEYTSHTWYEIYRYPNTFEPKNCSNVSATYQIQNYSTLQVINSCKTKTGYIKKSIGRADLVDKKTKSKLKVSFVKFFGKHFFYGDYWIIALDKAKYDWAIVSDKNRKYLWILSRTPQIDEKLEAKLIKIIEDKGFDKNRLIKTLHTRNT